MSKADPFDGCSRGFTQHSRSFYAKNVPLPRGIADEIHLGYYHFEGGTAGEMKVQWVELSRNKPVPQLCVFDDAWAALDRMSDLITALAKHDDKNMQPDEFRELLLSLGFQDMTNTTGDESDADAPPIDTSGDSPMFAGTRIPLSMVFARFADGDTEEEILFDYPALSKEHIRAAWRYAAEAVR